MKIGRVNIEGFMAIGSAPLGLASRGLVLIQGENHDDASAISNGAGKSTIPDALSWCLYGVTARGESGDDIINTHCKTASVVVELMDNEQTYRVSRYRKDKKHKNHVVLEKVNNTATVDLTLSSDKETQLRIDQIVGCDVDVFNAAIYQGQECIPDMPNMTDKQIKNLIEQAAGISVLEDCYKIALFEKNEKEKLAERFDRDNDAANEAVVQAKSDVEDAKDSVTEWDGVHTLTIAAAKTLEESSLASKQEADEKLARAEEKVPTINASIAKHKTVLEEKASCDSVLRDLQDVQNEQSATIRLAQGEIDRLERGIKQNETKLASVNDRIGTACGECGKPIEEVDLASVKLGVEMVISQKNTELDVANKRLEVEQTTFEAAAKRSDDYEEAMRD